MLRDFVESAYLMEIDDCILWPYSFRGGQAGINNMGGRGYVSRINCERVHGAPPSRRHQAIHSCGNGHLGCINKRHLNWGTTSDNRIDAVNQSTHNTVRLTQQDVIEIRKLNGIITHSAIGRRFGVRRGTITAVINHMTWAWVVDPEFKYNGPDYFK